MSSDQPWRPPNPYAEDPPRKRPYSPPGSPSRNTRPRNPIYFDVLYEQGPLPIFATFSSRGSRAIACFRNALARVWNVEPSGRSFLDCEHVLRHPETVFRAAVCDDGTRAVTTAGDGVARVWDLKNRASQPKEITSQYRSTRCCDISSDGRYVSTTFYTGKKLPLSMFRGLVLLYEMHRDEYLFRISVHGIPDKVKVSRNATTVAVGCCGVKPAKTMARDTRITIYDRNGQELRHLNNCFPSHDACVSWDLSDDGHVLAVCAENRQVVQVYSDKGAGAWGDPPLQLKTHADLTFEICRIVDDGDLITTLALDNHTKERSVLVFRPHTETVLFSLSCGLSGQKTCLDLEPRICYATPTFDQPGKKVARLLSRTLGDINTVELVRCGDPPVNQFRPAVTDFGSTPPYSSLSNLGLPANARDPLGSNHPRPVARMLEDSPTPRLPKRMDWSPVRAQSQLGRTNSLPQDDKFTLRKTTEIDNVDDRISPSPKPAGRTPSKNGVQKKQTLGTSAPSVSTKEVQDSMKPTPKNSKRKSDPISLNSSPMSTVKSPLPYDKEKKPAETVLSPKSEVIMPRAHCHAKSETLTCKSTIPSQSKLHTTTSPKPTGTRSCANTPAVSQLDQGLVHSNTQTLSADVVRTSEQKSTSQVLSDQQLTTTKQKIRAKSSNNDTSNFIQQTQSTEKEHGNAEEANKTAVKREEQPNMNRDIIKRETPVPILKKPRWQPGLIRARRKMLEKARLESKTKDSTLASTEQEGIKGENCGLSRDIENNNGYVTGLNERTKARISNPSKLESPGDRGMRGSKDQIPCDQPFQDGSGSSELEPSLPDGTQYTRKCVVSQRPPGSDHPGVVIQSKGVKSEVEDVNTNTPIRTANNAAASSCNESSKTPENQANNIANDAAVGTRTLNNIKNEQKMSRPSDNRQKSPTFSQDFKAGPTAKQETLFDHPNTSNSSKTLTSPRFSQVNQKEGALSKARLDPIKATCKDRYFEALERAKTVFGEASHEVEGERVLSNVKAFKAMLMVVGSQTEKELIDRRAVAKTVYEKGGGINNTLSENLFLEVFSHLYEQVQGIRQRQWTEVFNRAAVEEGEGLLIFHARDLIKRESSILKTGLNPIWNDESLDELIASHTSDGILVDQDAFVRSTNKIFSI